MSTLSKVLIALILLAMLCIPVIPVEGAQVTCKFKYQVLPTMPVTLRIISKQTGASPWDIRQANKAMMAQPNYPIFPGSLCIPYPSGTTKALPAYILDQALGSVVARASRDGKKVSVDVFNGPRGANFYVKVDGRKIGKIKIVNKGHSATVLTLPAGGKVLCIKNQLTDWNYCVKIVR